MNENKIRRIRNNRVRKNKYAAKPSLRKADIAECARLYLQENLTQQQIADKLQVAQSAVSSAISAFIAICPNPEDVKAYKESKSQLLSSLEMKLVRELSDADKLKASSINNLAYAFQNVNNANRLEEGKSTINAAVLISSDIKHLAQSVIDKFIEKEINNIT